MDTFFTLIGQAAIGWIIADLIGGFAHWYLDRVARPRWDWLEKSIWAPNRVHHEQPMAFTTNKFFYRNSTTFAAASVAAGLWLLAFGPSMVLLFAYIGGLLQNEVHYWTHKKSTGWIGVLQQTGIVQSIPSHARHHKPPQNRNYCILTDWCNPVLERLDVWNRLERRLGITDINT